MRYFIYVQNSWLVIFPAGDSTTRNINEATGFEGKDDAMEAAAKYCEGLDFDIFKLIRE